MSLSSHSIRLSRTVLHALVSLLLMAVAWGGLASGAMAAEILSVRSPTMLRLGDQNRSYGVELACISVNEANRQDALRWLQRHGPRGTKVNFRPIGHHEGQMVAKVSLLNTGVDLGEGLVAEGLATPLPCLDGTPSS